MLSLDTGNRVLYQIDKNQKKVQTIYYNQRHKAEADYTVENYLDVLSKHHFKSAKSKFKLSEWDINQLKRFLKTKTPEKITSGVLLKAYEYIESIVNEILKNTLLFDAKDEKDYELIPAVPKNGYTVISITAPSGAGKSTMCAKIIKVNKKKDQKIFLLSRRLREADPAFEEFQDDIEEVNVSDIGNLPSLEDLEDSWLLVDDLEGLPKQTRDELYDFIDAVITTGRKLRIKTIFSAHLMSGFTMRHIENESQYKIVFPNSNKHRIKNDLRLKYHHTTHEVREILDAAKQDGSRYLIMHLHSPSFYATKSRVVLT